MVNPINDRLNILRTDLLSNDLVKSPRLTDDQWALLVKIINETHLDDDDSKVNNPSPLSTDSDSD